MAAERTDKILKKEDAVYIVRDGEIFKVETPSTGFGNQKIIWQYGKPHRTETMASAILAMEEE